MRADRFHLILVLCLLSLPMHASATTVREIARLRGQGESILHGIGLVGGLNGTGDSGKDLIVARPLAQMLSGLGNPVPNFEELKNSKSVALVMITCVIPETGAEVDDTFDVRVSVINEASSLEGGELWVAPLTAAIPNGQLYAFAQGPITIEDPSNPTAGRVRLGARMVRSIDTTPDIGGAVELIIHKHFAGWTSASQIASQINQQYLLTSRKLGDSIARVVNERTIRLTIPEQERADPAAFLGDVLSTEVNMSMLGLPATVVVNPRTGGIVVTGDVRISPAVITHRGLTITTTTPPPVATPDAPIVERRQWAAIDTESSDAGGSSLSDLIKAFEQLDVPPRDQIEILQMLHRAGKLQARLVVE
ncbi:MAG: flagellar basal body P-ring protein FlgI [Phycisphaerales bacterium]